MANARLPFTFHNTSIFLVLWFYSHVRTTSPLALEQRAPTAGDSLACRARADMDVSRVLLYELGVPHELLLYAFERQLLSPLGTLTLSS